MKQSELKLVVERHELWLASGGNKGARADFAGRDLAVANLSGSHLSKAFLCGAFLAEANFSGADLTEADLSRVNSYGANLAGADLTGACLTGADLVRADLTGANLTGADLAYVCLAKAGLAEANLTKANLYGANLTEANLAKADLAGANLARAILHEANLDGAKGLAKQMEVKPGDIYWKRFDIGLKNWGYQYYVGMNCLRSGEVFAADARVACSFPGFHFASRSWCDREYYNRPLEARIRIPEGAQINEPWATDGKASADKIEILQVFDVATGEDVTERYRRKEKKGR